MLLQYLSEKCYCGTIWVIYDDLEEVRPWIAYPRLISIFLSFEFLHKFYFAFGLGANLQVRNKNIDWVLFDGYGEEQKEMKQEQFLTGIRSEAKSRCIMKNVS